MATSLPNFGTLSYNGINLNSPYTETLAASFRPIPDSAGRTVKYVEITLKFKTIINYPEAVNTEVAITVIRNALTAYGGAFSLSSRGLGNIYANVPGRVEKDVNYGPKPNVLSLRATNQYTVEIIFEIVVCLPQCTTTASYQNQLMAANYDLQFDIDEFSQTKRVFKGHIEIPVTRIAQGIRQLPDNADKYLLSIIPSTLAGFKRTISRHLNEAKTLLEVTVTDTEMGLNIPPPGVVLISADHSHQNKEAFNFATYGGTLSAEYQLQKGTEPEVARQHFFALYEDRRAAIMASASVKSGFIPDKKGKLKPVFGAVLPCNFSASEPDIYGEVKRCKFSLQYIVTTSMVTMLTAGLWRPVPNSDWNLWAQSMNLMSNPYGLAGLKFENNQDAIVDLCQFTSVLRNNRDNRLKSRMKPPPGEITPPVVPEDETWIDWENVLTLKIVGSTLTHTPSPKHESKLKTPPNPIPVGDDEYRGIRDPSQPDLVIQKRGLSSIEIVMAGFGVRYMYGINQPRLVSVGGVPVTEANRPGDGYATKQRGMIQIAKWSVRYLMPTVPLVVNPLPILSSGLDSPKLSSAVRGFFSGLKRRLQ